MDIVEFLTARLAEDAKRWQTIWRFQQGDKRIDGWWDLGGTLGSAVSSIVDTTQGGRDIAAKRAIMLDCAGAYENGRKFYGDDEDNYNPHSRLALRTLRRLAEPYAEHPDYDPRWADRT